MTDSLYLRQLLYYYSSSFIFQSKIWSLNLGFEINLKSFLGGAIVQEVIKKRIAFILIVFVTVLFIPSPEF